MNTNIPIGNLVEGLTIGLLFIIVAAFIKVMLGSNNKKNKRYKKERIGLEDILKYAKESIKNKELLTEKSRMQIKLKNNRTEKPRMDWKEKKEKGTKYEMQVGEELEKKNYKVIYRGIELGLKDGGIDIIATKGDEIMLVQCKNWISEVGQTEIKNFYASCDEYIKTEKPIQKTVKYRIVSSNGFTIQAKTQIKKYIELGTNYKYKINPENLD